MTPGSEQTRFLNVDLELVATIDLDPLLERLASDTFTLRDSVEDGRRTVWLELSRDPDDADGALLAFAGLIEALPSGLRRAWAACVDRCLNIGIQGAPGPHASALRISTVTLARIAALGARLEITVYGSGVSTSAGDPG